MAASALRSLYLVSLGALASAFAVPASEQAHKRYTERSDGIAYSVFERAASATKMSYVNNSGICETTPGVNQYSGYLSVGDGGNMFFWMFEARKNPSTAPLALWLNGGPGCSSMIGLFQEQGPCHFVNGASSPSLNPYSWNSYANMLYVDQPVGTGFSYGTDDATSTVTAAEYVWNMLQTFYAAFPQYESRDFGLWTESYGGHYGPAFAAYIESQNAAIAAGTLQGETIKLVALGVNNGWFDPILQEKAYIDYSANNTYRKIISASQYSSYLSQYNSQCLPALQKCPGTTGTNSQCVSADNTCYNAIEGPLSGAADFDVYDIRAPANDPNPPETYVSYLQSSKVQTAIGAKQKYQECPNAPYNAIANTGDDARSFLPALSQVVQSGIPVLLWAGDADWICNYMGGFAVANAVTYSGSSTFKSTALKPYTVQGTSYGLYKTVGNFNWLQVYAAGHEVPYYQPALALQVFTQIMSQKTLTPT